MRKSVAVLLLLLAASWCAGTTVAGEATTVILVRHAEKQPGGSDPGLTPEGLARARALARTLHSVELSAVFTTQFRRTRDTAATVAKDQGLRLTVDPADGKELVVYARSFVDQLFERHAGEAILVVGHSNTVPAFIDALGAGEVSIGEQAYDDMFVVTVSPEGDARLLHLHYGEPSRIATTDD